MIKQLNVAAGSLWEGARISPTLKGTLPIFRSNRYEMHEMPTSLLTPRKPTETRAPLHEVEADVCVKRLSFCK